MHCISYGRQWDSSVLALLKVLTYVLLIRNRVGIYRRKLGDRYIVGVDFRQRDAICIAILARRHSCRPHVGW